MNNHWLLKDLFTNTPNVVLAVDEHFHVFDLNPAAATLLGLSSEQVVGQHCSHLMRCRNMNRTLLCGTSNCPVTHVIQQKQPIAQEELILGQVTDSSGEFACSIIPVEHEQSTYVVFGARDVSGIKMANRVRANFVSMVSHELRTPLNSVHGFVDLLLQGYMGKLNEEQLKYLGYVQEGVQQLVSTVEDILLLTRSDSGQFEMKREEVDFELLFKTSCDWPSTASSQSRCDDQRRYNSSDSYTLYRSPANEASSEQSRHQCHQIYTT